MADPFYEKNLVEENLGCVIKRTGFMVSNDLNTRGEGTPYNGLYGEAPPKRGTFFRLQV